MDIKVEPTFKRTFAPTGPLKRGTEIHIEIHILNEGEQLQFHLCGLQCNTATEVEVAKAEDFSGHSATFTAPEDGEYYFWVHQTNIEGEDAAISVATEEESINSKTLTFTSGAKVTIYK